MNFDQFAASFQKPEASESTVENPAETQVETQEGEVVLAGNIAATTKESCLLDINGVQYEIASSDVIDIQVISSAETVESEPEEAGAGGEAAATEAGEEAKENVEAAGVTADQVVLVKVKANAILCRRIPVQAALVAAMGTWVEVVLPAAEAA